MYVDLHSERTDHQRMAAPMWLQRDPPIRCYAAELTGPVKRIDTERILRVESEGLVTAQFQIQEVIDRHITADAADARGKRALDRGACALRAVDRRYRVREGPGRRGVPQILNGWIVVGRDAVDNIERADAGGVGIADVGVVPRPGMLELVGRRAGQPGQGIRCAIGHLRERADVFGERTTPKSAERRQHDVVVRFVGIGRRRNERRLRVGIPDDRHHRDRWDVFLVGLIHCRRRQRLHVSLHLLVFGTRVSSRLRGEWRGAEFAAAGRISQQLESSAIRCQRWKIGVAGAAGLAGLARETRKRLRFRRKPDREQR